MPATFRDYYATLGISRDATPDQIKKAFRKLARQYHPDTAQDKPAAEEKFKEINEAHEVLSDPEKRAKYDRLGPNWDQPEPQWQTPPPGTYTAPQGGQEYHFTGNGFSDFFEQMFGGAASAGTYGYQGGFQDAPRDRTRRGRDVEGDLLVSLEEVMHGAQRRIAMQRMDPTTGAVSERLIDVRVPAGVLDGQLIRVAGQGSPGMNGGKDGDLFLHVRHSAHPDFSTRESDVYHDLDIAPWEAVLGAKVEVPTLHGSIVLRIPPDSPEGRVLRVKGKGLPKKNGSHGDFFVTLNTVLPTQVTEPERQLWQQLRQASTFNPRA